ncbi:hypothetical protein SDC9_78942 [bioreactor metagenome]|uniref:Uncharacterized protein n=1 Tax=bioreactor metagenome TaxID=1076179 RepID=A0A644YUU8_9ZZZZ
MPGGIHVEKGTDPQERAEKARRFRDSAPQDVEGQIRGKKPVVDEQLICFRPLIRFIKGRSPVPHIREHIHQKTIARGRPQGINDLYFSVRVVPRKFLRGNTGRIVSS